MSFPQSLQCDVQLGTQGASRPGTGQPCGVEMVSPIKIIAPGSSDPDQGHCWGETSPSPVSSSS